MTVIALYAFMFLLLHLYKAVFLSMSYLAVVNFCDQNGIYIVIMFMVNLINELYMNIICV